MGPRRDSKCFARNSAGAMRPMAVAVFAFSVVTEDVVGRRRERPVLELTVARADAGIDDVHDHIGTPGLALAGVICAVEGESELVDAVEAPEVRRPDGVNLLVFFDVLRDGNKHEK